MTDVVISGSFIVEPLRKTLSFWLNELSLPAVVRFAPYNQVYQTLLQQNHFSEVLFLLVREMDFKDHREYFIQCLKESTYLKVYVLVCPNNDSSNEDCQLSQSEAHCLYVADWIEPYFVKTVFNAYTEKMADMPFHEDMYVLLGTLIARLLYTMHVPRIKLIGVDGDQTLWKGVLAEENVQMHVPFQKWLKSLTESGIALALFSKNEESDVKNIFETHPEIVLKQAHFVAWYVNWDNKGINLRKLIHEMNIGADSVLYLDDHPVECAIVESAVPEAAVTLFDPHAYLHIWEIPLCLKPTYEDLSRTEMYQQQRQRECFKVESGSLVNFIQSLHLQVKVQKAQAVDFPRVLQLMERTNQFNTNPGLKGLDCIVGKDLTIYVVNAQDRFGDYGTVGVLCVFEHDTEWIVEGWWLSCRALGKGVEYQIAEWIGNNAMNKMVLFRFRPSSRNQPALKFLESLPLVEKWVDGFQVNAESLANVRFTGKENFSQPLVEEMQFNEKRSYVRMVQPLYSVEAIQERILRGQTVSSSEQSLGAVVSKQICSILNLSQIDPETHLFAYGLDSFDAAVLSFRLQEIFHRSIDIADVLNYPSVLQLSRRIESMPMIPHPCHEIPLSKEQMGIWYGWKAAIDKNLYAIHLRFQWKGNLDQQQFERAIQLLQKRHDLFYLPLQNVALTQTERFNYVIFENKCIHFMFHHLICDAQSITLFMQELSGLYNQPALKMAEASSYQEYSMGQNRELSEASWEFWKSELSWRTVPLGPQRHAQEKVFRIRKDTRDRIAKCAMQYCTTPFVVLMTLYSQALAKIQQECQFYIAIPLSTRKDEHLFGPLVNVFPFAVDLTQKEEQAVILKRHQKKLTHLFNHRHTPFYMIQEKCAHAVNPAFAFNWIRTAEQTPSLSEVELVRIDEAIKWTEYDLACTVEETSTEYELRILYARHYVEPWKVEALIESFKESIQCL